MLSLIPVASYSVRILQYSITGKESPPHQLNPASQIRNALKVEGIFIIWWFSLSLMAIFVIAFFSPVTSPISEYLSKNIKLLNDLTRFSQTIMEVYGRYSTIDLWIYIEFYYEFILGLYTPPLIFSTYAQKEKIRDLLSLNRIKTIISTRNYVKLGILSAIIWFIFLMIGSKIFLLIDPYFGSLDSLLLDIRFESPVLISKGIHNLVFSIIASLLISFLLLVQAIIVYTIPFIIVSRVTGRFWHTIESNRDDRKLLVDKTKQRKLHYYRKNRNRLPLSSYRVIQWIRKQVGMKRSTKEDDESGR